MKNETIEKLTIAIDKLMTDYERVKAENIKLKDSISTLENEKNNFNMYKENESTKMTSMLNKIESTLSLNNIKKDNTLNSSLDFAKEKYKINNQVQKKEIMSENNNNDDDSKKINLDRMNSLLQDIE